MAAGLASGKKLCRILRQQDCLTAHPRHGNIQARLRHTDAVILTAGGGRWLSCPSHAHSILLLPWRTGLYGFSLSWVMALPVLPCTDFRRTGLSLVPLKLSYWRAYNRKITGKFIFLVLARRQSLRPCSIRFPLLRHMIGFVTWIWIWTENSVIYQCSQKVMNILL